MTLLAQAFRAWLEVSEYVIPATAQYQDIQFLPNEQIGLTFRAATSAELDAVFLGRQFTIGSRTDTATLEAKPNSTQGTWRDRDGRSGYELFTPDPQTPPMKVYACRDDRQHKVEIVEEISGDNQITIAGNEFTVSPDLVGVVLLARASVLYPEVVLMKNEPLETFTVHLIGKASDQTMQHLKLEGCKRVGLPLSQRKHRMITIAYQLDHITRQTLKF